MLVQAQKLFRQRGVDRTSLEAIAEAAGLTRGAIYSNFKDKRDLFLAMIRETPPLDMAPFAVLADRTLKLESRFRRFARAGMSRFRSAPRDVALQTDLLSFVLRDATLRRELAARYRTLRAPLADGVRSSRSALTSLQVVAVFHALIDGLAIHRAIDPELFDDPLIEETLVALSCLLEEPSDPRM